MRMQSRLSSWGGIFTLACLLFSPTGRSATYKFAGIEYDIPANVTAGSSDSYTYEGLLNLQNDGRLEFKAGSHGTLIAGDLITLSGSTSYYTGTDPDFINKKMGFMAHDGSTVHGMIDENLNGISDYIEELDADGDGLYDNLEDILGTSSSIGSPGFETDVNGDGLLDKIVNVVPGATTSQFVPGNWISGYMNGVSGGVNVSSFYEAQGTYYGQTVGYYNSSSIGVYFGSLSEWLELNFSITYTYFIFDSWTQHVDFQAAAGTEYIVQGYHNGWGWFDIDTVTGTGGYQTVIVGPETVEDIYSSLEDLPIFIRLVALGVAAINSGSGTSDSDEIEMDAVGSIADGILTVKLPEVMSLPSSSNIDWIDKRIFGNTTPWQIDLDGNGTTDVTLNPINQSGKVSVPILGKTVEIEVKNGQGVFVGIGKYKIGQLTNGSLVLELPDSITGSDGTVKLTFAAEKMRMRLVDRDDTENNYSDTNDREIEAVGTTTIYSGSDVSRDHVAFYLTQDTINAFNNPSNFSWKAVPASGYSHLSTITGPQSQNYIDWIIDGNSPGLNWGSGKYIIKCEVQTNSGLKTVEEEQDVGVRTDDVFALGFINKDTVALSTSGVQSNLLTTLPSGGIPESATDSVKMYASWMFRDILEGIDLSQQFEIDPPSFLWPPRTFNGFTQSDRDYFITWMFKYGGNDLPPTNFVDSTTSVQLRTSFQFLS